MAGIYLHVPFCKQACHYCDFHFSTNTKQRTAMVQAMVRELALQQDYLGEDEVHTIYLGGGTPSLLTEAELGQIMHAISQHFSVASSPEITLEANPDDLTPHTLASFRAVGINRLSIGIQSFYEPHLRYLNRAHSAAEASRSVHWAQEAGFDNVSVDLIYAIPADDHCTWQEDIAQVVALHPQHISAYCLTIEEKTVFGRWQQRGKLKEVSDDFAAQQFELLITTLTEAGYDAYEVSNFCLPGCHARHNSSYWQREKYLGIGPSAHSFDGMSRQYNVAHNTKYLQALADGQLLYERELLSRHDQINEWVMTGLRTKWGCDLAVLQQMYEYDLYAAHADYLHQLVAEGKAQLQEQRLVLTNEGRLLADGIAEALFVVAP